MSKQAEQKVTVDRGSTVRDIHQTVRNYFLGGQEEQHERAQRNRLTMLKRVKGFWVEGVLENSLNTSPLGPKTYHFWLIG